MRIEILSFEGCPNHEALLPRLRELMATAGVTADVELRRIEDVAAAERERFLGSPTLRIDGVDVEPGAADRSDFGLKCRLFAAPDGLRGLPADEWVLSALTSAQAGAAGRRTPVSPRLTVRRAPLTRRPLGRRCPRRAATCPR